VAGAQRSDLRRGQRGQLVLLRIGYLGAAGERGHLAVPSRRHFLAVRPPSLACCSGPRCGLGQGNPPTPGALSAPSCGWSGRGASGALNCRRGQRRHLDGASAPGFSGLWSKVGIAGRARPRPVGGTERGRILGSRQARCSGWALNWAGRTATDWVLLQRRQPGRWFKAALIRVVDSGRGFVFDRARQLRGAQRRDIRAVVQGPAPRDDAQRLRADAGLACRCQRFRTGGTRSARAKLGVAQDWVPGC